MPRFLSDIFTRAANPHITTTGQVNRYEGISSNGQVVLSDRRGTRKAEVPVVDEKGITVGSDPLAIYRPSGAKTIDATRAMANFTGWTYAAVNAVASEVAGIQLRLYQVKGNDHQELDDHELLTLLDAVNPHMTGPELKYITMSHLELTGNCFWLLDGADSATAKPRAIYPLNPGGVRVKINKTSFPYKLSHYEYTLDTKVYTFQPHQILHFKYPDPNDPFVGIGIPQTIASWINSDNYAMEYNRKFFINGAQVGLYIQTDTNVEGNLDRIRKSWGNRQEGVESAHRTPVLPKGVKLEHTGVTERDMDFDKLTTTTRDRILAAFRVSKTILGTAESDTNRATAESADYVFSKRTIKPKVLLLVSYLNEFFVSRYGDDLYLTFIDPTPEDKAARTTEMQAMVGSQPVMTVNEARQNYAGLGPIEGGDQLMGPTIMAPRGVTDTPEGDEIAPGATSDDGSPGKGMQAKTFTPEGWAAKAVRVRTGGKTAHSGAAKMRLALTEAFTKAIDKTPAFQVKSFGELTHAEYMEHWKRFSDRSERAEAELHRIFEGINAKQKEEVLANLSAATGIKTMGELFDPKEWIGLTIDLATPVLTALAKDEAASALAMIGAASRNILAEQQTRAALEQGISRMARSYNQTTLSMLEEKLGDKLTQQGGANLTELRQVVEDVYDYADTRRAGLIAKTESFRAANWANHQAWAQSGMVKTVQWYTSEKDNVCEFCSAMEDRGPIPIEENFADSGDTIVGTKGGTMTADYGDIAAPPAHPDCSCFLRPAELADL